MATVPVGQLAYGVREVESGGVKGDRYKAVNGIGAHGAYQVMQQYIGPWTKEAFGRAYTPEQFLNSPGVQDKLAEYRLGRDQKKYGSWEKAAAVWFSGRPDPDSSASDGGNTVREYIDKVRKAMAGGKSIVPDGTADDLTDITTGGVKGALEGGSLTDVFTSLASPLTDIAQALMSVGDVATFVMRLALPSTWVRIMCGVLGLAFLLGGLVVLGLEAKGS